MIEFVLVFSEIVHRLRVRYANVNIIEVGCQLMSKKINQRLIVKKSISIGCMKGGRRVSKKKIRKNRKSKMF